MSTLDDYVASLKSGLITLGDDAIYGWLVAQASWLAWPGVKQLVQALIDAMLSDLAGKAEFLAFAKYIDLRVSAQGTTLADAMRENHAAQTSGNPERILRAEKNLRSAFDAFGPIGS